MKRRDFIKGSAMVAAGAVIPACGERGTTRPSEPLPHRWIDQGLCIGCGECVALCPMGAIEIDATSSIDPDRCAECGVCWRSRVCPVDAIRPGQLNWPRVLREVFSNPLAEHESTGVPGRGTEGIKTNDSTLRYRSGSMGVFVKLGRPAMGARFSDAERVVEKFARHGYRVVPDNPVAELVADPRTGALRPEILNEKAISILIEFIVPASRAEQLISMLGELSDEVETVFNVCIALRAGPDGSSPLDEILPPGTFSLPNGKVNIGLAVGMGKA